MQSQEDDIENETKPGNPLVDYFKTKLSNIEKCVEKDSMQAPDALADNRSYSSQLLTFIKKYLTEMPLWSGVLLGRLDRYREEPCTTKKREVNNFLSFSSANTKSEGYIEGAMRNLKQEDFSRRKRLRADTFVYENYSRIRRRLCDYGDRLHSRLKPKRKRAYKEKEKKEDSDGNLSRQLKASVHKRKNYHDAQEKWGKKDPETPKHNPRLGQFQQSPKIPLSSKPDFKKGK